MGQQAYMAAIDDWENRTQEELLDIARKSISELTFRVVVDTPVDTGFLRGSWSPSIGDLPPVKDIVSLDPGGGLALADAAAAIEGLTLGDTFYYANGCIYARRLEYGFVGEDSLGRYYNQAGRNYVSNNVANWQSIVDTAAMEAPK